MERSLIEFHSSRGTAHRHASAENAGDPVETGASSACSASTKVFTGSVVDYELRYLLGMQSNPKCVNFVICVRMSTRVLSSVDARGNEDLRSHCPFVVSALFVTEAIA